MKRIKDLFSVNPLVEFIKNDKSNRNYILYAEGGIGKTTALLCLNQCYINQVCQGDKIIPVFIDVKRLDDNESKPLLDYIYKDYCGKDSDIEALKNLLNDKLSFASGYEIVFLIDGFNEAGYHLKGHVRDEILELIDKNNKIKFIVSSRVNEIELQALGFSELILEGLSDDRIKSILGVKEINSSLLEILRIPLFMDKFLKTYNKSDYDKINNSGIIRKSHILNSYVEKLMKDTFEKKSERKDVLEFIINKWLPALAYEMVRNKRFTMECDFAEELFDYKYFAPFFKGSQREASKHIMNNDVFEPFSLCCKDFALLAENNGNLSFVHHIWRDFFAARHIINIMKAEKLADLEVDLDENIRRFVGELVKKGDKCECDYETKKDCNSESSPIEDFLQKHNLTTEKSLSAKATANLIEIMNNCRNKKVTSNYNDLDLSLVDFMDFSLTGSTFHNSILYNDNFTKTGHNGYVYDVLISEKNRVIISCGWDNTIRLWDIDTHYQIGDALRFHRDWVVSIAMNPEENLVASSGLDKIIYVWDIKSRELVCSPITGLSADVRSMKFICNDGLVYCMNNNIRIRNIFTGDESDFPIKHQNIINVIALDSGRKHLVSGGNDSTVYVWDIVTKQDIGSIKVNAPVKSISIANDEYIVCGCENGEIVLIDLANCKINGQPMKANNSSIECVVITTDCKYVVCGGYDGELRIWDLKQKNLVRTTYDGHSDWINGVAITSDDKYVVSASGDQSLKVWDMETLSQVGVSLKGDSNWVNSIEVTDDCEHIITVGDDKVVHVWECRSQRLEHESLKGHRARINVVALADKKGLIVTGSDDNEIKVWDFLNREPINAGRMCHDGWVRTLTLTPEQDYIVSGGWDNVIRIWNIETYKQVGRSLVGHNGSVEAVAITKSGIIVSGSDDGTIRLWDMQKGKSIGNPLIGHTDRIRTLTLSPDEKYIISGGWDTTIRVWDIETCKEVIAPLIGHQSRINCVRITPDKRYIVSGSDDRTIRLWDLSDYSFVKSYQCHENGVSEISLNKKYFFTCGQDGAIKIWTHSFDELSALKPLNLNGFNIDLSKINKESDISLDLYKRLYQNGANVPDEYIPDLIE